METVPCKMNDGFCTIPDHALIVRQGEIGVRSRAEIVRDFPDVDLKVSNLRPFQFDGTHDDLLEGVRRLERHGDMADTSFDDSDEGEGGPAMMETVGLHAAVAAALADANVTNGLIVYCSPCGHHWVVDL
jgi:hypothetical protein